MQTVVVNIMNMQKMRRFDDAALLIQGYIKYDLSVGLWGGLA